MKNTTQMIEEKPRFFCNCRRVFGFLFLLLFAVFHSQIFQLEYSHILVQGKAIVFSADSIQTKNEKGKIYISDGSTIYSDEHIINARLIVQPKTWDKNISLKYRKSTSKNISKNSQRKKYNAGTGAKAKINSASENKIFINFLTSAGSGVITPASSFPKFIISNVEYKTDLNNFSNRNSEQFYHTFTFYNSYRFYIYIRPPPFSFILAKHFSINRLTNVFM